jgi:hypothetical protein
MSTPKNDKTVSVMTHNGFVVTFELDGDDQNYSANYWVSSMYPTCIQLLANVNLGIYAYDREMAHRVAANNVPIIAKFVENAENANADLSVTPPTQFLKEQHARLHMEQYDLLGEFEDMSLLNRTLMQVTLCQQFGVKNLAKLIADFEKVNIRTIHERIQRLRKEETNATA